MSLVIQQITKSFGPVRALDGVSFTVEPGRIFGLLGANGAGKTTCMRIVLDILRPDDGTVTWQGTANTDLPRRTWGYLPEERGLYLRMKVIDVLRFFAALYNFTPPLVSPPTQRGFVPARANSSMNAAPISGMASAKQVVSLQSKYDVLRRPDRWRAQEGRQRLRSVRVRRWSVHRRVRLQLL